MLVFKSLSAVSSSRHNIEVVMGAMLIKEETCQGDSVQVYQV